MIRQIKKWNETEEKILIEYVNLGLKSEEIAKNMGRTICSIENRKHQLRYQKQNIIPVNKSIIIPITPEEIEMYNTSKTAEDFVNKFTTQFPGKVKIYTLINRYTHRRESIARYNKKIAFKKVAVELELKKQQEDKIKKIHTVIPPKTLVLPITEPIPDLETLIAKLINSTNEGNEILKDIDGELRWQNEFLKREVLNSCHDLNSKVFNGNEILRDTYILLKKTEERKMNCENTVSDLFKGLDNKGGYHENSMV